MIEPAVPEPKWLADIRANSRQRDTDKLSMRQINSIVSEVRLSTRNTVGNPAK